MIYLIGGALVTIVLILLIRVIVAYILKPIAGRLGYNTLDVINTLLTLVLILGLSFLVAGQTYKICGSIWHCF